MLRALPHTQGADRERVLLALKNVAAGAESSGDASACLDEVAAGLIRYLPSSEQRDAVDRILDLVESKQKGWLAKADLLRALAGLLDREQVARVERYAGGQTHCCVAAAMRAILAKSRQFPADQALKMKRACAETCGDDDVLQILPLVDARTRAEFLAPELKRFDDHPESWSASQLHSLAKLAPYLEEKQRHQLMARAFRWMPELGVENGDRGNWGELGPPAHYQFILERLAPVIAPDLLPSALTALPDEWPPEIRSAVLGNFVASLPPEIRRRSLSTILDALPGPSDSLHFVRARLLLAADLPEDEVRTLFDRFLELEKSPRERAEVSAELLGNSGGKHRAELERSFLRELERIESAPERGRILATAIEQLN